MHDTPNYYFVGIGGIGMAALARYYLSRGAAVAGYDRTPSALTRALESEGATITFDDNVDAIPAPFRDPQNTTVVYTPAVPADNAILTFFRDHNFDIIKRAALLGRITGHSRALCFAGTHGKTTTSSMAAHILNTAQVGCNAFLGGILRNYNSNLILSNTSPYSVIEADEYDRSFHHLRPYIALITATDPDHLDIYGTPEAYRDSFAHFTSLIRPDGALVVHTDIILENRAPETVKTYTYGRDKGDFHATYIRTGDGNILFDLVTPHHGVIRNISLGVPVDINIENAVGAMAVCLLTSQVEPQDLREAMSTFLGAERRFQFHLKQSLNTPGGHVIIDDYAHHPDEIRRSLQSIRALYPNARITAAFQPHLYSRTRDFAPQFAEALSLADDVILLDIYPAREKPIPGVTSQIIFDDIHTDSKTMCSLENFADTIKNRNFEVLVTLGAGDLSTLVPDIAQHYR